MNKPTVLLVDDDRSVLDALGTVIESEGFELVPPQTVTRLSKTFASNPSTSCCSI
jgi:FixJ family two-component response regulator